MNKDGTPSYGEEIMQYGPGLLTVTRLTREKAHREPDFFRYALLGILAPLTGLLTLLALPFAFMGWAMCKADPELARMVHGWPADKKTD